jgi:hypothetical protein
MVLGRLPKDVRAGIPVHFKKLVTKHKTWLRPYHYRGNPIMIAIAWLHGVWAEDNNYILWMGWGLLVILAFSGWTMKRQGADGLGGKTSRLIHFQHSTSILMLILLLVVHTLAEGVIFFRLFKEG